MAQPLAAVAAVALADRADLPDWDADDREWELYYERCDVDQLAAGLQQLRRLKAEKFADWKTTAAFAGELVMNGTVDPDELFDDGIEPTYDAIVAAWYDPKIADYEANLAEARRAVARLAWATLAPRTASAPVVVLDTARGTTREAGRRRSRTSRARSGSSDDPDPEPVAAGRRPW